MCNWIDAKKQIPPKDNHYLICIATLEPQKPIVAISWYDPQYGWSCMLKEWVTAITHWAEIEYPKEAYNEEERSKS